MKPRYSMACALFAFSIAGAAAEPQQAGAGGYVAGLAPHQRPAGAPVIKEFARSDAWRKAALTGVDEPLPAGLKFLDSQGAWYSPFVHPGMPGYYDLRQWHAKPAKTAAARSAP